MSSVHSNPFDTNSNLHIILKETEPSVNSNNPIIIPSLKDSLRDKINQLGVQLVLVKTAVQESGAGQRYDDMSKVQAYFEEKISTSCDQIRDLSQMVATYLKQLDVLLSQDYIVNCNEVARIFQKMNQDLQILSNLVASNAPIKNYLLDIDSQLKKIFLISLRSQLILLSRPFHLSKVHFGQCLQDCLELKAAIDHVIEQTQEQMSNLDIAHYSKAISLICMLNENFSLAWEIKNQLSPLLNTVKAAAYQTAHSTVAASAAEKGKAARGKETLLDHLAARKPLKRKSNSVHDVYLVNNKTVFKNNMEFNNQPAVEEQIIRNLALFKCKRGIVESFQVREPGVNLKYDFNQLNKQKRYFDPLHLTSKQASYFLALKPGSANYRMPGRDLLVNFIKAKKWKNKIFAVIKDDGTKMFMSFDEVTRYQADYKEGYEIDFDKVYLENSTINLNNEDNFDSCIEAFNKLTRLPHVIAPLFHNDTEEQAYIECEKCGWYNISLLQQTIDQIKQKNLDSHASEEKIREAAIKILEISFSTLKELQIDGKSISDYHSVLPLDESYLKLALNCDWEMANLTLKKEIIDNENDASTDNDDASADDESSVKRLKATYEDIKLTEIKPFLSNMILYHVLKKRPSCLNQIMQKITPESQYNLLFLSGECQLLDLHAKNIGLSPVSNPFYDKWKDQTFTYQVLLNQSEEKSDSSSSSTTSQSEGQSDSSTLSSLSKSNSSFQELMLDYLDKRILLSTPITFSIKNQPYQTAFLEDKNSRDMNEIITAIHSDWEFNFFDLDRCLSESNEMINFNHGSYIAPFSSALLFSTWKDVPLDPSVVERLKKDKLTANVKMNEWLEKTHSPLLTILNRYPEWRNYAPVFNTILSEYSLKDLIKKGYRKPISIKDVRNNFVNDLANEEKFQNALPPMENSIPFWQGVETILSKDLQAKRSTVKTLKEMSWKELEEEYHTDEELLKNLNPHLCNALIIPKGTVIKRPFERKSYDLTSRSPDAREHRKKIAKQLFPRMTDAQIKALKARQEALHSYLENFEQLNNCTVENLEKEIIFFIGQPTSPISSLQREALHSLTALSKENLLAVKNKILSDYQPTYFNVMKAIYPLTADLELMGSIVFGSQDRMAIYDPHPHKYIHTLIYEAKRMSNPLNEQFIQKFEDRFKTLISKQAFGEFIY